MKTKLKLTAIFEKAEEGGYIAYIAEIPGVNTQGETLEETRENLKDALAEITKTRRKMTTMNHKIKQMHQEPIEIM